MDVLCVNWPRINAFSSSVTKINVELNIDQRNNTLSDMTCESLSHTQTQSFVMCSPSWMQLSCCNCLSVCANYGKLFVAMGKFVGGEKGRW